MAADVKFSGQTFLQYGMTKSRFNTNGDEANGANQFDVSRARIAMDGKFDEHWSGNVTMDGQTTATSNVNSTVGQNVAYLKYAYVKYSDIMGTGINVVGGLIGTLWTPFEESLYGHRYVVKSALDQMALLQTVDKGVSVWIPLPMDFGTLSAMVANGEGYQQSETGLTTAGNTSATQTRQKDYQVKLSITPLPKMDMLKGLQLHAYMLQGRYGYANTAGVAGTPDNRNKNLMLGAISFKNEMGHLMYEYFEGQNAGTGTSVSGPTNGLVNKPKGYAIHAGANLEKVANGMPGVNGVTLFYDYYRTDPAAFDTAAVAPAQNATMSAFKPKSMWVAGVEKAFNPNVRFAFDVQNTQQYGSATTPTNQSTGLATANTTSAATTSLRQVTYYLHGELKF